MLVAAMLFFFASHPPEATAIAPPPRPKWVRPIPRPTDYMGEVLAVTSESVTIHGRMQGDLESPEITRVFKPSTHLAKGEQDPWEGTGPYYLLTDIKVGDKVWTKLRALGEDDICLTITIRRRPKGIIPPAPFESPDNPHKYHDDMNAYQAFEERAIPLPLRLNEDYQRWLSMIQSHEYDLFCKKQDHTAPPPRPVIRK